MRDKPYFIIIGASRSGTSSLFAMLLQHPQIVPPRPGSKVQWQGHRKELHFFDKYYNRGFKWYLKRWPNKREDQKYFEATPNYLFCKEAPVRALKYIPKTKFVVMLRNPVNRAWGHFWADQRKIRPVSKLLSPEKIWVDKGDYAKQLKRWFKYFPREQFFIIKSEKFFKDPVKVTKDLVDWLGLKDKDFKNVYWDPLKHIKPGSYSKPHGKAKDWLTEHFRAKNKQLYELLGQDFEPWE